MAASRVLEVVLRAKNELDKGMSAASKSIDSFAGGSAEKMGGVGRAATLGVSAPIAGIGVAVAKLAMDFETSMNVLQGASGASSTEIKQMEKYAKEMGAATVFSSQDAANAMVELSKAGMTTSEIMNGGLAAAMSIAATEGMDLGAAATVASNAMSSFGIPASQAATVADALAGASGASTASVASLSEALSQVGPGAVNAGLSLQDTVGVLASFDQAGIKGSDAGTSLKTMLTRLVPVTDTAKTAMEKYGLSFVDGKGNIDSITTVAAKLQTKLGGLSEEQRTAALSTIFGSDATRAATVLMKNGAEGTQKYIDAATKRGSAEEMAASRTKGSAGSIEAAMGSAQSAGIALGQALLPVITDIAKNAATVANKFAAWWEEIGPVGQKVVLTLAAVAMAVGPILSVVSTLIPIIGFLAAAFTSQGIAAAIAWVATLGPVALVIAAIALVAGGIYLVIKNWDKIGPFFSKMWDGVKAFFSGFWTWVKDFAGKWGIEILAVIVPFLGVPLLIAKHWDKIGPALSEMWDGVKKGVGIAWDKIRGALAKWGPGILAVLVPFIGIPLLIRKNWDKIGPIVKKVWDGVKTRVKTGIDNVITYVKEFPQRMVDGLKNLASMLSKPIKAALKVLGGLNPFMRHSPSLVDNVLAGTAAIAGAYAGLSGMTVAAPKLGIPSVSMAGIGSIGGVGASARPQEVRVYLDGRELNRGLSQVAVGQARTGVS